jgi:hypothetical protein
MAGTTNSIQLLARAAGVLLAVPGGAGGRFRGDGPFLMPTGH